KVEENRAAAVAHGWLLIGLGVGAPALALTAWARGRLTAKPARAVAAALVLTAVVVDFAGFSCSYNPVAPESLIYPPGDLTRWLATNAPGERLVAVNRGWSLYQAPRALLPPNAALAYRQLDAQGYDSLFLARYKRLAKAAQGEEPSPQENGNIVFFKRVDA